MPSSTSKIIGLTAALAALGVSAAQADEKPVTSDEANAPADAARAASMLQIPIGDDLMNFVVGENEGGMVVADHSSHASHASHSSHHSSR